MDYETIHCASADRILTLTLNRPAQLNAFTVTMANELVDAFTRASDDDTIGAIIVTGAGRAFCAGMDLAASGNVFGLSDTISPTLEELRAGINTPEMIRDVRDTGGRVTLAIFACKKPVIAAINGAAVGIGATMTLAMDFRMASTHARIGFVFGRLGIVPEAASSWFLPRLVGLQQALEWVYTADIIDAEEALRGRLLRSIHAPETLLEDATAFAKRLITNRSPVAIALARQMLYRNPSERHPMAAHEIDSLAMLYVSRADGREGIAAFREKREPHFVSKASEMPPFYPW